MEPAIAPARSRAGKAALRLALQTHLTRHAHQGVSWIPGAETLTIVTEGTIATIDLAAGLDDALNQLREAGAIR
jgi:hypothetical protein